MSDTIEVKETETLLYHLKEVEAKKRRFESAAQSVSRMILEKEVTKISQAGKTAFDFTFFREGKKHIVGWYNEINEFVHFVKDAAEGGSAKEMAFVLVGEPGNGKTFFIDFLCSRYRQFLLKAENARYTFEFVGMKRFGEYGNIEMVQSQTFEDPMILAMNLFGSEERAKEFLAKKAGFSEKDAEALFRNYRPLGACTEYIVKQIYNYFDGDINKVMEAIRVVPVPMAESLGTVTGKYSAKDKITSSATDLLGEESLSRLLNIPDTNNPYKLDLRRGAIARVAGGGIHFSDEMYKNKKDLVQIYLGVIQNRNIEIDGFKWPIDCLIVATSNNWEYNRFVSEKEESPIKDRCRVCYVSHNTDHNLQRTLTAYAVGDGQRTNISGEEMHEDPNLNYAASVAFVLTRLLRSDKLTPEETMKLEAGEVAGEKGVKTLAEVKERSNTNPDVTKRWGQRGLGHRDLGRAFQILESFPEANEGKCMFALDIFRAIERIIFDYVPEAVDRDKYMEDLKIARQLYHEQVGASVFNAYRDDKLAIQKDVMIYINMIIGIDEKNHGPGKTWKYQDPQTGEMKAIKIDEKFIESVEERMQLKSQEQRESSRNSLRKIYARKMNEGDKNYNFMDNPSLVKAVTDVRLQSDIAGAGSLVGALANRTNDENEKLYNRMLGTMFNKLGYCPTCAEKTLEYFCAKEDES